MDSAEVVTNVDIEVIVELLFVLRMPPTGPVGGEVLVLAFLARRTKASKVLPVVGALMAPTIPAWQWFPTVCPQ